MANAKSTSDFKSMDWTFPGKNARGFKGAVQEYKGKDGDNIAVAFTPDGAFVIKDDVGYFTSYDYTGRGGIFSKGLDTISEYEETKQIGAIYITEDGQSIDAVMVLSEIDNVPFADIETVKADIEARMRAVAPFGFFSVTRLG